MATRAVPALAALAVLIALGTALIVGGDPSPDCLPAACDCEEIGSAPIRQPINAWSSLALSAVGIGLLLPRSIRRLGPGLGIAVAASGAAAFSYHATLSAWAARLDGLSLSAIVVVLGIGQWSDRADPKALTAFAAAVVGGAAALGANVLEPVTAFGALLAGAGAVRPARRRGRDLRAGLLAIALLALGGALWWLGRSGGPWCPADGPALAHGMWHLVAAAAVGTGAAYLSSGRAPPRKPGFDLPS